MTTQSSHASAILVTGAAGAVGSIGRNVTEMLLAKGHKVRALVRREDERAGALRQLGAEVMRIRIVAVVMNPDTPFSALALQQLRVAADTGGQVLEVFEVRTADKLASSLEAAVRVGASGLITIEDPFLASLRREIVDLAAKLRLPTIYGARQFVEAGGLISYGTDMRQIVRRAAEIVDKILKGTKPGDIPVEQPTKFELVINVKTAKTLDLEVPPLLLTVADEVIE